ncbi:hypothetical protein [Erythrobacter phage vB_EliS-L02]|nr:hypothetical protein [Erythrobacter phage vB_EliS-L02]
MQPTPSLHGTDLAELVADRINAITAVQTAQEALAKLAPHGRDYADHAALQEARDVHWARLAKLEGLIDELTQEGLHIQRLGEK